MKKYLIRSDLEGVTGIVHAAQAVPGGSQYASGVELYMGDLLALCEGLRAGGADAVLVYDQHCDGRNTDVRGLPPYVTVVCGKPPYREDWPGGLDSTFAGMVFLGAHGMAGTPRALLNHSYEAEIAALRVNGVLVGEIGMEAAIAGDCGVPLALVIGDSAGCAEAAALVPGVRTVVVKESVDVGGAVCRPPSWTAPAIQEAARQLVADPPTVAPFRQSPPVTLEFDLRRSPYLDAVRRVSANLVPGTDTLRLQGPSAVAAWAAYWQLKLRCQMEMSRER